MMWIVAEFTRHLLRKDGLSFGDPSPSFFLDLAMLFGTKHIPVLGWHLSGATFGHAVLNWTKFRIVAETEPLDEKSVDDDARWAKLSDAVLKPGKNQSRARTRAQEDHGRLKQQLRDVWIGMMKN